MICKKKKFFSDLSKQLITKLTRELVSEYKIKLKVVNYGKYYYIDTVVLNLLIKKILDKKTREKSKLENANKPVNSKSLEDQDIFYLRERN